MAGRLTAGRKDDAGKPRWDLLPYGPTAEIVQVLTLGAAKYGDHNWRLVAHPRARYFAAAMRHLVAWFRGEARDPESGLSHLAHAATCILFLMGREEQEAFASVHGKTGRGTDGR